MTTEGGLTYRDVLAMDEKERLWWVQKCLDHNEEMEERMNSARR